MKEESARGSPELLTDIVSQRKARPVPVNFVPLQSETSAFHRVAHQPLGLVRQPTHGYVQPAGIAHTSKLVAAEESEKIPFSNVPGLVNATFITRIPADALLDDEKSNLGQNCGPLKFIYSNMETEQEKQPIMTSEGHGQGKNRENHIRGGELEKSTIDLPKLLEPKKELKDFKQWIPEPQVKTHENVERSERIMYLQNAKGKSQVQEETPVKHKLLMRSMSDYTGSPELKVFRSKEHVAKNAMAFQSTEAKISNGEITTVDTKVSVAQLRNAFLETANTRKKPEL